MGTRGTAGIGVDEPSNSSTSEVVSSRMEENTRLGGRRPVVAMRPAGTPGSWNRRAKSVALTNPFLTGEGSGVRGDGGGVGAAVVGGPRGAVTASVVSTVEAAVAVVAWKEVEAVATLRRVERRGLGGMVLLLGIRAPAHTGFDPQNQTPGTAISQQRPQERSESADRPGDSSISSRPHRSHHMSE